MGVGWTVSYMFVSHTNDCHWGRAVGQFYCKNQINHPVGVKNNRKHQRNTKHTSWRGFPMILDLHR